MILAVLLGAHSARYATGFFGQGDDTSGICDIYNANQVVDNVTQYQVSAGLASKYTHF